VFVCLLVSQSIGCLAGWLLCYCTQELIFLSFCHIPHVPLRKFSCVPQYLSWCGSFLRGLCPSPRPRIRSSHFNGPLGLYAWPGNTHHRILLFFQSKTFRMQPHASPFYYVPPLLCRVVHFIDNNNNINFFWFVFSILLATTAMMLMVLWRKRMIQDIQETWNRQAIKMLERVKLMAWIKPPFALLTKSKVMFRQKEKLEWRRCRDKSKSNWIPAFWLYKNKNYYFTGMKQQPQHHPQTSKSDCSSHHVWLHAGQETITRTA
jgi:hypothetical protein